MSKAISLRDYQIEALGKLRNGCILCGKVGSGKSRTALAWYYTLCGGQVNTDHYIPMKDPLDLYIITTARKRDTMEWEQEFIPFMIGTERYSAKVTVDSWNNIKKYKEVTNAVFIFDEQRVVGSGAWVKAFLKITKQMDPVIGNPWRSMDRLYSHIRRKRLLPEPHGIQPGTLHLLEIHILPESDRLPERRTADQTPQ